MKRSFGFGFGFPMRDVGGASAPTLGQTMAADHIARVQADNGVVPAGQTALASLIDSIASANGVTTSAAFNAAVPVIIDSHYFGYRLGAGSGTTSGQAARTLYALNSSADVVQTTAGSQPLLLAHSGQNYFFSPGINGNYLSSTNVSCGTNSGCEVDILVSFNENLNTINASGWLVSHDNGSTNRNLFVGFSTFRTLITYWSNLTRSATATATLPVTFSGWIRVSLETSGSDMLVKYFTSSDGVNWSQLGSTVTNSGGANTYGTAAAPVSVTGNGGANVTKGNFYRAIYKDANGNTIADFNPASYNAATSQTQWTSATGEVWTINTGTAATGYKGVLVDRTIVQGDGVDDRLFSGTLNLAAPRSNYVAGQALINTTDSGFIDGNNFPPYQNLIRQYSSGFVELTSSSAISIANSSLITKLITGVVNGASSSISINNGTPATGTTGTETLGALNLFRNGLGTFYNSNINSVVISSLADSAGMRTAMYNIIRSMNNNAF